MTSNGNGKSKMWWQILVPVALAMLIAIAVLTTQWQSAIDGISVLNKEVDKLFNTHKEDIARLDESNRNRRNQIADLEERIARVEERTGG